MTNPTTAAAESYCTFCVDGSLYGIEVPRVQEVIRSLPMTPVPLAPKSVRGLINLRGQIVSSLDLHEELGLFDSDPIANSMNVIIRVDEDLVSLSVDEIGDVVEVDPNQSEPIPGSVGIRQRQLLRCAFQVDDRLLLVLDADRVAGVTT